MRDDKTSYHYDTYVSLHFSDRAVALPNRIFSEGRIKLFTDAGRVGSPVNIAGYTTPFAVRRVIFDYYHGECRIMLVVYKENHNED